MKSHLWRVMVIGAALCFSLGWWDTHAAEKPLKVGVGALTTAYLPLFLAKEKGFFEREGFDVKFTFFKGGTECMQALISRGIDIGMGSVSEVEHAADEGQKGKIFFGVSNTMKYYLLARPEIKSMNEAKGKTFAISKIGSLSDFITRYIITTYGLDPDKDAKILQIGSHPARFAALKSGAVDLTILDEPLATTAREQGFNQIVNLKDSIKEWQTEVLYAMEDYLKTKREDVKKFLKAYTDGIKLAKKDPEEAIKTIMKYVGVNRKEAEIAYKEFVISWPDDGHLDKKSIQMMIDFDFEHKNINKRLSPDDFIDSSFILK